MILKLTTLEEKVLSARGYGCPFTEIAEWLNLSVDEVSRVVGGIIQKLHQLEKSVQNLPVA